MEANKQAKLPAVVSATPAVVQMERAHVACYNSTCALQPALRSRCVYLESAPVEIEIYI